MVMERELAVAVAAAEQAGGLQRERFGSTLTIDFKGEANLVTEVDRQSEKLIVETLLAAFPHDDILAEEGSNRQSGASRRWIIDPLDGTTNYAHAFPWFAVSIALERGGELVVGVVYHVMLGEMFTAVRGQGAFLNGKRLTVSKQPTLRQSLLATGFPYDPDNDEEGIFRRFAAMHHEARGVRRPGAAALDLAYVAAGRFDGFWEERLNPWDMAAGQLLVEEAGGVVTGYDGLPHRVEDHRIVASNGLIHGKMLAVLR
jgi:myo-inositol-1(or 4)-monophosphatase